MTDRPMPTPEPTPSARWWLKRRIVVDRPKGYVVAYVLTEEEIEKRLRVKVKK